MVLYLFPESWELYCTHAAISVEQILVLHNTSNRQEENLNTKYVVNLFLNRRRSEKATWWYLDISVHICLTWFFSETILTHPNIKVMKIFIDI